MPGDDLHELLGRQHAHPLREPHVQLHAPSLRELSVGDVANQDVLELVLELVGNRRQVPLVNEVATFEPMKVLEQIPVLSPLKMRDCAGPEDRANNGRGLRDAFLRAAELVQTRADQSLQARRGRELGSVFREVPAVLVDEARVAKRFHRLFEEERIAARRSQQRCRDR